MNIDLRCDMVIRLTAAHFHLTPDDLRSPSRRQPVSYARQIAMYTIRQMVPAMSLRQIARLFGRTDHTTALHAITSVEGQRQHDYTVDRDLSAVLASIETLNTYAHGSNRPADPLH